MNSGLQKISIKEKIGYSLGDVASCIFFQSFVLFLLYFYTDVFGITAAAAGTLFLVTRIWDTAVDPVVGVIADRTNTRWGKFRPYLLWIAIPFGILGVLTFTTPDIGETGKIIYAYITYGLMMMAYSAINIPYTAMLGVITPNTVERTSLSSYKFVGAFLGGLLIQAFTFPMVENLGKDSNSVVAVSLTDSAISLRETGVGNKKIILRAEDPDGNKNRDDFIVKVRRAGTRQPASVRPVKDPAPLQESGSREMDMPADEQENGAKGGVSTDAGVASSTKHSPVIRKPLPDIELDEGFSNFIIDVSKVFMDPDGDPLKYTVTAISEVKGFQTTYVFYSITAVLLFFLTFVMTKERVRPPVSQKTPLKRDLLDLKQNGPWVALFFVGLFNLIWVSIRMCSIIYYFKYYVGNEAAYPVFLVSATAANILGVMATQRLAARFGKRRLFFILMFLNSISLFLFYLPRPGDLFLMYVIYMPACFLSGPTSPLAWAMYADTADYSEWKTGRRATGLVFSAAIFAQKMGWTVGGSVAAWLLAYFGYRANVAQTAETLHGIKLMMSIIPGVGSALTMAAILFYRLDEAKMKEIEGALIERRKKEYSSVHEK